MADYWPMAKIKEEDGNIRTQATYDSCLNIEKALECIKNWDEFYNFNIVKAWINVVTDGNRTKINVEKVWVTKEEL